MPASALFGDLRHEIAVGQQQVRVRAAGFLHLLGYGRAHRFPGLGIALRAA